jgi:hypothetical protein
MDDGAGGDDSQGHQFDLHDRLAHGLPRASILQLLRQCRSTHGKVLRTLAGQAIRRKSRGWSLLACQLLDSFDKHVKVLVRWAARLIDRHGIHLQ